MNKWFNIGLSNGDNDDIFVLSWNSEEHHLSLDFLKDGTFEWFYSNRKTNFIDGEEGLDPLKLPEKLIEYLRLFT